jgi:hypothetical protein
MLCIPARNDLKITQSTGGERAVIAPAPTVRGVMGCLEDSAKRHHPAGHGIRLPAVAPCDVWKSSSNGMPLDDGAGQHGDAVAAIEIGRVAQQQLMPGIIERMNVQRRWPAGRFPIGKISSSDVPWPCHKSTFGEMAATTENNLAWR